MAPAVFENGDAYDAYVEEKMHGWGMFHRTYAREWLDEVFENAYFTESMQLPYTMGEENGMLALNSTAESTRQYHANVKEYDAVGGISDPHWLQYQVGRQAGSRQAGKASRQTGRQHTGRHTCGRGRARGALVRWPRPGQLQGHGRGEVRGVWHLWQLHPASMQG